MLPRCRAGADNTGKMLAAEFGDHWFSSSPRWHGNNVASGADSNSANISHVAHLFNALRLDAGSRFEVACSPSATAFPSAAGWPDARGSAPSRHIIARPPLQQRLWSRYHPPASMLNQSCIGVAGHQINPARDPSGCGQSSRPPGIDRHPRVISALPAGGPSDQRR